MGFRIYSKNFYTYVRYSYKFFLGYRTNGSTNYFSEFLNYNPDFIINSGDVVDSYEESYWTKVGSQWPGDWGIYNDTIKKIYLNLKL